MTLVLNRRAVLAVAAGAVPLAASVASASLGEEGTLETWVQATYAKYPKSVGVDFGANTQTPHFQERHFAPAWEQLEKELKSRSGVERRRSFVEWTDEKGKPRARFDLWYEVVE